MNSILLVDDDISIRESVNLFLTTKGFYVTTAADVQQAMDLLNTDYRPDLIVTDLKMPGMMGYELLSYVRDQKPDIPVIVITAFDEMHATIRAMELGAYDYIEKPLEPSKFLEVIHKALETRLLSETLATTVKEGEILFPGENILVGKTPQMKQIFKKIGQLCSSRVTVLIQGESGTGKELISKIVHNSGVTRGKPFVGINCSALSENLLESELFGHMKGSFTGAIRTKKGKFELAGDGTLFLDEISEISPDLQVKLLRVLEEKEFEPVGGEVSMPLSARVIAATNKNLAHLVNQGHFREDLYYRLNVVTIDVPPLRERKEDIPLMVIEFLKKINKELHKNVRKIPFDIMELLQSYDWIGNVRELYNTLLQAVVLSKGDVLEKENILIKGLHSGTQNNSSSNGLKETLRLDMTLDDLEKIYIGKILVKVKWNKQEACKVLGITKPTLNSKIKKYSLNSLRPTVQDEQ
jgi:DNA-binding NtrC family response regulator